MLLKVTNTSGASLAIPFPISETLAAAASTEKGVSLRDLLFDAVKGDEAWRTLTGLKQAGKITFELRDDPTDTSLDPLSQALLNKSVRMGRAVAAGAGDVAVAFGAGNAFPAATFRVGLGPNNVTGLPFVKDGTKATTGFTLTFAAAGECDWIAFLY